MSGNEALRHILRVGVSAGGGKGQHRAKQHVLKRVWEGPEHNYLGPNARCNLLLGVASSASESESENVRASSPPAENATFVEISVSS